MDLKEILKNAELYVVKLFKESTSDRLPYHNLKHTIDVVNNAKEIAKNSDVSKSDKYVLLIAAWFHDTGYLSSYNNHEDESVKLCSAFLASLECDPEVIDKISSIINATKHPQTPNNLLEGIICDADLLSIGKKKYFDTSELLRIEWGLKNAMPASYQWPDSEIDFLIRHKFFTQYAIREYSVRKNKNIIKLRAIKSDLIAQEKKRKAKKILKERKNNIPSRGVETLFRVAFRNHMDLSSIADNKANIMLSINAIILSISFSTLFRHFDDNPYLIIPSILLVTVCIITIVFATLSTSPKVKKDPDREVSIKRENPLFFGNFHKYPYHSFEEKIWDLMADKKDLYGSLMLDLHELGSVLHHKYRFLKICYNTFMYGMIVVVITFVVSFFIL